MPRLTPLLLILFTACPAVDECVDADGDGSCAQVDCDDSDASLSTADADQDGQSTCDGDCDDADPTRHALDADADGVTLCDPVPDCDDTDPTFTPLDADGDGVSTCDPTPDCDDDDPTRSPLLTEICGDGLDNDCSGTEDDLDADGDGEPSLACGGRDCDDRNIRVGPDEVEECTDGLDNDCSGAADAEDTDACGCDDADGDGYACDDVDDANALCGPSDVDADADGACEGIDVDDDNAHCTTATLDVDGDRWCVDQDVDDANPNCTANAIDEDLDGWCVGHDIDDTNPTCTTTPDTDADGVCDEQDTAPNDPLCFTSLTDADGDGFCEEADADDTNPTCRTTTTDADGDGVCAEDDCDDTRDSCATGCDDWYVDADRDGYASSEVGYTGCRPGPAWRSAVLEADCDDTDPELNPGDLDGDGVSTCDAIPDCDDADPSAFPGGVEVCDFVDNDCMGGADDGFPDTDGDGLDTCLDACPAELPPAPVSIRVDWMGYRCPYVVGNYASGEKYCNIDSNVSTTTVPSQLPVVVVNDMVVGTLDPAGALQGCYGQQGVQPPISDEFPLPAGLWNAGDARNTVTVQNFGQSPQSCSAMAYGRGFFQMNGWIATTVQFSDADFDRYECHYGPCGASHQSANSGACGRPSWFFGTGVGCPDTLTRNVFLGSDHFDTDGDGVPVECDTCPDDPLAYPGKPEDCSNGIDDNCDGFTDADDAACCLGTDTTPSESGLCFDDEDNDCDGLTDLVDPDCVAATCATAEMTRTLVVRAGASSDQGTVDTCDAGPAPGVCATDNTTQMAWLDVPVRDPDALGWSLEVCATDLTAVVFQQNCANGTCAAEDEGCYRTTGIGDAIVNTGLGTDGDCAISWTATLTVGSEAR